MATTSSNPEVFGESYQFTSAKDIHLTPNGTIKKEAMIAPKIAPAEVKPAARPGKGRKSKAEAISKIALGAAHEGKPLNSTSAAPQATLNVRTPVLKAPVQEIPSPMNNPARKAVTAKRAAPLDFTTLRTIAPRDLPQRENDRPFGLEHCPVFYPTIAEFSKPMEYIEQVAKECGDDHGLAKIVPPEGWKPPFSLDSEVSLLGLIPDTGG